MFRQTRNTLVCLSMALVITGLFGSLVLAAENTSCYDLCIAHIDYRTNGDEVVVLLNKGREPIDLTGYTIRSEVGGQQFTFGVSDVSELNKHDPIVQPLDIVRVHVKDCLCIPDPRDFIWINKQGECYKKEVWNDKGDAARLYSANGDLLAEYSYP